MKIHRCNQGSDAWLKLRSGRITASNMHRLVTPLGKIRTGEGPETMLCEMVAERLLGEPLPQSTFFNGEQGNLIEESARPAFTLETGLDVQQIGFIETDDGAAGCSPDGIIVGQECGLEIKCPMLPTAIKYLISGEVPPDYVLQIQTSLFVTGWQMWKFMSFRRGWPPLILDIEPDDKIQDAISEAVAAFTARLDEAMATLTRLNGGTLPKPPTYKPEIPLPY